MPTPLRDATALLATVVRRQTPSTSTTLRRHYAMSSSALATAVPYDQIHRRRLDPSPPIPRDPPSIVAHSLSPLTGSQGLWWILRHLLRPASAQHRCWVALLRHNIVASPFRGFAKAIFGAGGC
ncbi:hypothetical protein U1Q18_022301 [Sarracenia purpurea var. burkii]